MENLPYTRKKGNYSMALNLYYANCQFEYTYRTHMHVFRAYNSHSTIRLSLSVALVYLFHTFTHWKCHHIPKSSCTHTHPIHLYFIHFHSRYRSRLGFIFIVAINIVDNFKALLTVVLRRFEPHCNIFSYTIVVAA